MKTFRSRLRILRIRTMFLVAVLMLSRVASAQGDQHQATHDGAAPQWHFMQDGALFTNFNVQGSPRGETELVVQNWWMAMWGRTSGRQSVTLTTMISLDPATVGKSGYSEIFQVGETLNGRPLTDRQHPHDFLAQAGAAWRYAVSNRTGITIGGGLVGEPSLGPVVFLHRPSATENPTAPLGHHTLDSTHLSMGVINAAIDRGPWVLEGSVFNGREPDEQRWDLFDPGPLDSWSGRLWFQPGEWQFQVSHGRLKHPEALEAGDTHRTTASAAWLHLRDHNYTAAFIAFGRNGTDHGDRNAVLAELARKSGLVSLYGRFERVQVETDKLFGDLHSALMNLQNAIAALTVGGVLDAFTWHRLDGAFGGDVTVYGVPDRWRPAYGSKAASVHFFLRIRPSVMPAKRMWNMRMSQPMHSMMDEHAGHQGN